ncbi:MAG: hypothetical protein ACK5MV_00145 [Aminipila sp.]
MNKVRRSKINAVIQEIETLKETMQGLRDIIEEIKEEEEDCLENIPENLQGTDRYDSVETAAENLESAYDWFDESDIDDLLTYLEEAKDC